MRDEFGHPLTAEAQAVRAAARAPSKPLLAAIVARYRNKFRKKVLRAVMRGQGEIDWRWQTDEALWIPEQDRAKYLRCRRA